VTIVLGLVLYLARNDFFRLSPSQDATLLLSTIFFPTDMVLYVIIAGAVACCYFWWGPDTPRHCAIALTLTFSSLLAFRILMHMRASGYSIFYNGPVVLSFLLLVFSIVPRTGYSSRSTLLKEAVLCLACLTPVLKQTRAVETAANDFVQWNTSRGAIRVSKDKREQYTAAIQFMKDKAARGESVLSVPEDTSLYFFSGTYCPTRVYLFTPGALAPGKMVKETIEQIDRKPVRYLLWSNRTFQEYGVPIFGQDFDRPLGEYLRSHYRPIGPLLPETDSDGKWSAVLWERTREGTAQ
jgi:hypothetical protein